MKRLGLVKEDSLILRSHDVKHWRWGWFWGKGLQHCQVCPVTCCLPKSCLIHCVFWRLLGVGIAGAETWGLFSCAIMIEFLGLYHIRCVTRHLLNDLTWSSSSSLARLACYIYIRVVIVRYIAAAMLARYLGGQMWMDWSTLISGYGITLLFTITSSVQLQLSTVNTRWHSAVCQRALMISHEGWSLTGYSSPSPKQKSSDTHRRVNNNQIPPIPLMVRSVSLNFRYVHCLTMWTSWCEHR